MLEGGLYSVALLNNFRGKKVWKAVRTQSKSSIVFEADSFSEN